MAKNGGKRPGAGRPKGAQNKLGLSVKQSILDALEQAGGTDYLLGIARTDPKTFCALIGRVLPTEVTGGENAVEIVHKIERSIVHVKD